MISKKQRKLRSDLRMYQLPKDVLEQVNEKLTQDNMSYRDIQHWHETTHDTKIGLSSICRYAFQINESTRRIANDLEKTKFIVDHLKQNPDFDTVQITTNILKSGLLQRLSSAEEEFNELPIEQASKLFLQIAKTESGVEKTRFDMRTKIDLAFDELETQLMDAIKHYPILSVQLREILVKAKEKIDAQENGFSK